MFFLLTPYPTAYFLGSGKQNFILIESLDSFEDPVQSIFCKKKCFGTKKSQSHLNSTVRWNWVFRDSRRSGGIWSLIVWRSVICCLFRAWTWSIYWINSLWNLLQLWMLNNFLFNITLWSLLVNFETSIVLVNILFSKRILAYCIFQGQCHLHHNSLHCIHFYRKSITAEEWD